MEHSAGAVARPFQLVVASAANDLPDMASFDQWLLFPMKLGLSIALASTAMIVSPLLMAKRLETMNVNR